jgi:hypothetical protein
MNAEELNRLIEKYYNGESTEEEERTLRDHFKNNDIPEGCEAEKVIFGYYAAAGEVPEPSEGFEARIMSRIDATDTNSRSRKFRRFILPYLSAAAGLLILAGSWFFFVHRQEPADTFKDPVIAYAETMKILRNVSSQLNHGVEALEPVGKINEMTIRSFKSINKSTKIIGKSIKNLNDVQKEIEMNNVPSRKSINK